MTDPVNRYPKPSGADRKPESMHENVQVWDDCCCCEAEPYWLEAMAEDEREKRRIED